MRRYSKFILAFFILFIIVPIPTQAQDHPPQLLYQKDNLLYLTDATTGESVSLPGIEVSFPSTFMWSLDGRYLLAIFHSRSGDTLRVYDVDRYSYLKDINISGEPFGLDFAEWSPDGTKISFSRNINFGAGQLWLLDLVTGSQNLIYQAPEVRGRETGVYDQWWSPVGNQLLFEGFHEIMGGTDDNLTLIDLSSGEIVQLYNQFFASYQPLWSSNGEWILLTLYEDYSGRYSESGNYVDQGDVFLFSTQDGTSYQITQTPEIPENNLRWSKHDQNEDIQYELQSETITIVLEDVINYSPTDIPKQTVPYSHVPPMGMYETTSTDGKFISYFDETNRFWIFDTNLEQPTKMLEGLTPSQIIGWRP